MAKRRKNKTIGNQDHSVSAVPEADLTQDSGSTAVDALEKADPGSSVDVRDTGSTEAERFVETAVSPVESPAPAVNETVPETPEPVSAVSSESAEPVSATTAEAPESGIEKADDSSSDVTAPKKEKKKKVSYHVMLFMDSDNGSVRQMGINQKTAEIFLCSVFCIALALVVVLICLSVSRHNNQKLRAENESLASDVASLESRISVMDETISTQSGKITALSNTVNEKVTNEKKQEKEDKDNHIPSGFPLSTSSTYSEPDEFMIITFKAETGTNVLATGDGTVVQVTADPVYSHCIVIDHENGYLSYYRNAGDPMVKEGDEVDRGDILFITGSNNKDFAYNISKDDKPVNPLDLMKIDG